MTILLIALAASVVLIGIGFVAALSAERR